MRIPYHREISFTFIREEGEIEEKNVRQAGLFVRKSSRVGLIYQVTCASCSNKDNFFVPILHYIKWMLSRLSFVFLLILVMAAIYRTPRAWWFRFCRRGSIERSRKLATVKYSVHLRQTRCSPLKELLSQGCVTAVVSPFCGQPSMARLDRESVSTAAYAETSDCYNPFN